MIKIPWSELYWNGPWFGILSLGPIFVLTPFVFLAIVLTDVPLELGLLAGYIMMAIEVQEIRRKGR